MKRRIRLLLALTCIGIASYILYVFFLATPTGPVYSPTQVEAGLSQHSQRWHGRIVNIRATALHTGGSGHGTYVMELTDHWPPTPGQQITRIWVASAFLNPSFQFVAWSSFVARFLPGGPYQGHTAIYRVRLNPTAACNTAPCTIGQLQ